MCVTQPIGPLTREAHSPAKGTSLSVASPGPLFLSTLGHLLIFIQLGVRQNMTLLKTTWLSIFPAGPAPLIWVPKAVLWMWKCQGLMNYIIGLFDFQLVWPGGGTSRREEDRSGEQNQSSKKGWVGCRSSPHSIIFLFLFLFPAPCLFNSGVEWYVMVTSLKNYTFSYSFFKSLLLFNDGFVKQFSNIPF